MGLLFSGDPLHMIKEGILGTFLPRNINCLFVFLAMAIYPTESTEGGWLFGFMGQWNSVHHGRKIMVSEWWVNWSHCLCCQERTRWTLSIPSFPMLSPFISVLGTQLTLKLSLPSPAKHVCKHTDVPKVCVLDDSKIQQSRQYKLELYYAHFFYAWSHQCLLTWDAEWGPHLYSDLRLG